MAKAKVIFPLSVFFFLPLAALGSDFSRFEVFAGYSTKHVSSTELIFAGNSSQYMGGIRSGIAYNLSPNIGIVAEFGWNRGRKLEFPPQDLHPDPQGYYRDLGGVLYRARQLTFLIGPRFSIQLLKRFRPFTQLLIGWDKSSMYEYDRTSFLHYSSAFYDTYERSYALDPQNKSGLALMLGAGLDIKINRRFSIRLFEIETEKNHEIQRQLKSHYVSNRVWWFGINETTTTDSSNIHRWKNGMVLSGGAVLHLGNQSK